MLFDVCIVADQSIESSTNLTPAIVMAAFPKVPLSFIVVALVLSVIGQ